MDVVRNIRLIADFNPHPRVEGDRTPDNQTEHDLNFNPHPRVEGDRKCWLNLHRRR